MKKILALLMAALMTVGAASAAFAMEVGESRVVLGANLTEEQKAAAYAYFGTSPENTVELTVTNHDERMYFEGKLPDERLGRVALSCIYIVARPEGTGLNVSTCNINYCTPEMYRNALASAGITDAYIVVWAPYEMSGTAALTGIYKAYEDMTGKLLDDYAKDLGIEELIATGELAEYLGTDEALSIINEVKKILDETQKMDDDAVMQRIRDIARDYDVTLTDEQQKQIFTLARMFEGLSAEEIQQRLINMTKAAQKWQSFGEILTNMFESVAEFFRQVGEFFTDIYNKWFAQEPANE